MVKEASSINPDDLGRLTGTTARNSLSDEIRLTITAETAIQGLAEKTLDAASDPEELLKNAAELLHLSDLYINVFESPESPLNPLDIAFETLDMATHDFNENHGEPPIPNKPKEITAQLAARKKALPKVKQYMLELAEQARKAS